MLHGATCVPPPPAPLISSLVPSARARARASTSSTSSSLKSPPPSRATYHTATITARYTRYTPRTTPESHRGHSSCIAGNAEPCARARTRAYTHAHVCMHIDDFIHTRTHEIQTRGRAYTLTYSYARTLVRSYRAMHTCIRVRTQEHNGLALPSASGQRYR